MLGFSFGGSKKALPISDSQGLDKKIEELQKKIHADSKFRERQAKAAPLLRIMRNPQWYGVKDEYQRIYLFDDINARLEAANEYVIDVCGPFMRGGSRNQNLVALDAWTELFAQYEMDYSIAVKQLSGRFSENIKELARKWADYVSTWKSNYLRLADPISNRSYFDEDIQPAWSVYINEAPVFGGFGGRNEEDDMIKEARKAGQEAQEAQP